MVQLASPGVYVEEFAPAPPIQPASTSIAGFVGYALKGKVNTPTRITNFLQFKRQFGNTPFGQFFLWHAVRGFFENGGTDCFVVRASNGRPATWNLQNSNGDTVCVATARALGKSVDVLTVAKNNSLKLTVLLTNATTADSSTGRQVKISGSGDFRPGDVVIIGDSRATIVSIGNDNDASGKATLVLDRAITVNAGDKATLADLQVGDTVVRFTYDKSVVDKLPQDTFGHGSLVSIGNDFLVVESVQREYFSDGGGGYRVTFREGLAKAIPRSAAQTTIASVQLIDLTIGGRTYSGLSSEASHARYLVSYINERDSFLELQNADIAPSGGPEGRMPDKAVPIEINLANGSDEDAATLKSDSTFLKDALDSLKKITEVSLVSVPDAVALPNDKAVALQQSVISHCELLGDRFAILDPISYQINMFGSDSIETQRASVESARGYAGLYYPWVRTTSATSGDIVAVPPSGHVAGLIARIDKSRGVHKAPAGTEATLNDAVTVVQDLTNEEQGILNLEGINVIRTFKLGGRPTVFGARTTASDLNWQYVNIRRLFLSLEKSIADGLKSSVFEPNNQSLWGTLKRVITAFLVEQWRAGALFGSKADEAFYVKIDETLNPFNERALGKLTLEIGVSPSYPAEFIVVRIGIWDGGKEVAEA